MKTLAAGGGAMVVCYALYSGFGGGHSAEESVVVHKPANLAYSAVAQSLPSSGIYPLPRSPDRPDAELIVESKTYDKLSFNLKIGSESLLRYQIAFTPIDQDSSTMHAAIDVNDALFKQYFLVEKSTPGPLLPVAYKYALSQQLRDMSKRIDDGLPIRAMLFDRPDIELESANNQRENPRMNRYRVQEAQRQATAPMMDARPKSVRPMMDTRPNNSGYNYN